MMLKPGTFEWAQQFLTSPAWATITKLSEGNMFSFSLPSTLPSITISEFSCANPPEVQCPDLEDDTNDSRPSLFKSAAAKGEGASNEPVTAEEEGVMTPPQVVAHVPPAPTKAKRGKNVIISDTQVRRSERVHSQNKGFKNDLCKDRS
jgi:hypothetical protein